MTLHILRVDTIKVFTFIHNAISLIKCVYIFASTSRSEWTEMMVAIFIYQHKVEKNWMSCVSIDHRKEHKLRGLNAEIDHHLKHIKLSNMR